MEVFSLVYQYGGMILFSRSYLTDVTLGPISGDIRRRLRTDPSGNLNADVLNQATAKILALSNRRDYLLLIEAKVPT